MEAVYYEDLDESDTKVCAAPDKYIRTLNISQKSLS